MPTHSKLLVGIDPQTSLIAVQIKDLKLNKKVNWFQVLLKRKDSFPKAEEWQLYVVDQSIRTVKEIKFQIERYLNDRTATYTVFFAVEQQRGRVKTIPETCLVTAARSQGWRIRIPHPKTWKKAIGFYNEPGIPTTNTTSPDLKKKNKPKGHKQNKEQSQLIYEKELIEYCRENKVKIPTETDHLCDAACIVKFLEVTMGQCEKQDGKQEEQETAIHIF